MQPLREFLAVLAQPADLPPLPDEEHRAARADQPGNTEHFASPQLQTGIAGLDCAGEMLDWEAPTGGYLLQATFSTAVAAAAGVLDHLGHRNGG